MTIPKYVLNGERTGTCGKKKLPYVLSKQQLLQLLTFVKELIIGNALKASQPIFYFLVRYKNRNAVLIFLDGKGVDIRDETQIDLKQFIMKE